MDSILIVALGLYFMFAVGAQALARKYTRMLPRAQAVVAMYLGAALLSIVVALIIGVADIDSRTAFFIILTGCLSAVASYCQWQAYAHSLSKTSLFLPASDVIAAAVAALLFEEALLYQHGVLFLAVALLYAAAMLLSWQRGGVIEEGERQVSAKQWRWWLLGVLIGSTAVVLLMKFFSVSVPAPTFLMFHYSGAAVGALLLWRSKREEWILPVEKMWPVFFISAAILGALGTSYWAFSLAPVGLVLPIQGFGGSLLAVLAGWVFFKEKQQLTWATTTGFILGLIGLILLYTARF